MLRRPTAGDRKGGKIGHFGLHIFGNGRDKRRPAPCKPHLCARGMAQGSGEEGADRPPSRIRHAAGSQMPSAEQDLPGSIQLRGQIGQAASAIGADLPHQTLITSRIWASPISASPAPAARPRICKASSRTWVPPYRRLRLRAPRRPRANPAHVVDIGYDELRRLGILRAAFPPQLDELVARELGQSAALETSAPDGSGHGPGIVIEMHAQMIGRPPMSGRATAPSAPGGVAIAYSLAAARARARRSRRSRARGARSRRAERGR